MAKPNSENYSDTFENEISNYIFKNSSLFNELNYSITSEEINRAILLLKNNKSAGNDRILNEFLKTGKSFLLPYITKIFNMIFINGFYPSSWRLNTLTPVYKKGDKNNPENYRGIAVSSSISKLFCSVLNKRLTNFLYAKNKIPINQIGFRKGF